MPSDSGIGARPWWEPGVLYQIYPLSFADSNGDGIGDLQGIIDHVEYLEWFVDSRSSKTSRYRDWYIWADGATATTPPNNWVSSFGGPAWTLDPTTGQYYMHNHLAEQPDLNWWNKAVRDAFDAVLRFWFDRGVDGMRIDVCNLVVKDAELRDNPPATADDPLDVQMFGQRPVATRSDSRSTSPSSTRRSRPRRCARSSRAHSRCCPRAHGRPGPGRITTCPVSRPGGPVTIPIGREPHCSCCSDYAGRRSSTRATRSGCATGWWHRPTCAIPSG